MKINDYLKEVKAEMTHVSFPTRRQTVIYTVVVIALSLGMAAYLGFADFLFHTAIGQIFK